MTTLSVEQVLLSIPLIILFFSSLFGIQVIYYKIIEVWQARRLRHEATKDEIIDKLNRKVKQTQKDFVDRVLKNSKKIKF